MRMIRWSRQRVGRQSKCAKTTDVDKAIIVKTAKEVATKHFNTSHAPSLIALTDEFFPHQRAKNNGSMCTDPGFYLEESGDFKCGFWA